MSVIFFKTTVKATVCAFMPTNRSIDAHGRERWSVSPPRQERDARQLEAENERLRRQIIELQLEKKLGLILATRAPK